MANSSDAPNALRFELTGLSCAACVGRAEKAIHRVSGVETAHVNLATGMASVEYHAPADFPAVADALSSAGYPARFDQTVLEIDGMHCASCVTRVEKALKKVQGVMDANVNLATARASVRHAAGSVSNQDLCQAVAHTGYHSRVQKRASNQDNKPDETRRLAWSALLAALLALPVFILEMGGHLIPTFHHFVAMTIGEPASRLIQFFLTSAVLLGPGQQFYKRGIPLLLRGAPDMNSLVALGTAAAYLFSVTATFAPNLLPEGTANVYFESAAVIVVLILLGRYLEARAKRQTNDAIAKLLALRPETARVERDGQIQEIPLADLQTGDILHTRPGERLAADGIVVSGSSFVNESMLTGEPIPSEKQANANVYAGTMNEHGHLKIRITQAGDATLLAQIIATVEQAQGAKLPIQSLVDRITAVFVPVVLTLAVLTVIAWFFIGPDPALGFALVAGISVLIIACPCAMGLATPTSIMVGTGRAAELGVLFRKGDALQALTQIKTVVFDKTGTLTIGQPSVVGTQFLGDWTEAALISLVASVESNSEHPLSRAITDHAAELGAKPMPCTDFEVVVGRGVLGLVNGHRVAVGSRALMQENGIETAPFDDFEAMVAQQAQTPIFVAVDGSAAASFAIADALKPDAVDTISGLKESGKSIVMLTGDNHATATAMAGQLGIDHVISDVLPNEKASAVKQLQQKGQVAFVGDGINDAPALSTADVGIAIGTGTDIAIESADIVLIGGHLGALNRAFALANKTMRNIKQNLFWAFAYNVLLIPVAAGALYPFLGLLLSPMLAAFAMAFSSVFVVSNALRLRFA